MIPCVECQYMWNCGKTIMRVMDERNETSCATFKPMDDNIDNRLKSKELKNYFGY